MTRPQISRFTSITSCLLIFSLLGHTVVHASPAFSASRASEAKHVEKTVVAASTSNEPLARSTAQSLRSVYRDRDGISTLVTNDPGNYATIDIDSAVSVGFSLTDISAVEQGTVTPNGTTVFPVKGSGDAYAFQIHESGSISASAITMSSQSSQTFSYSLSDGITPVVQNTGAVALYEGETLVGLFEHPKARDASGREVPSSYSVVDGNLVQSAHASPHTSYPLVTTAKIGIFQTQGDYVHVTRGQASGHGWWLKGTTNATKAKVTVQLQYKPKKGSRWHNRGKAGVRVLGPGSSKRANARMTCRSSGRKQWRSWVDVDLIGYIDTPNKYYSPARTLKCTI